LKFNEYELQEKIREDFESKRFKEFLEEIHKESLEEKFMQLIESIKESEEYKELHHQIIEIQNSYLIELEGRIKELLKVVNDTTYVHYNVSGRYYLKDIQAEEIEFR